MNSIKTKSNKFSLIEGKAIAGVVFVPSNGHFIVYVAWEWPRQANEGFFAIVQSSGHVRHFTLNQKTINHVADYGSDVTHLKEVRKLFPTLF